jgi:hypothetical protein
MPRGRPKGSKDKQPRTASTAQKAKQDNGGHGGSAGGNGERGNSLKLSFNEQRQHGMLPRASVHAEDVNINEELNRQRVQAGQIASIFSVSTSSCHAFGLSFCILVYREVKMCTYRERSILRRTTVLLTMWFQVPTTLKVSL